MGEHRDVYNKAWLFRHPAKKVGTAAVVVTFSCHLVGHTLSSDGPLYGQLILEPVAITVIEADGATMALAQGASRERIEALLSDEARWSEVV